MNERSIAEFTALDLDDQPKPLRSYAVMAWDELRRRRSL
jgi:hypothetical protein